jgi:hypothetical protein
MATTGVLRRRARWVGRVRFLVVAAAACVLPCSAGRDITLAAVPGAGVVVALPEEGSCGVFTLAPVTPGAAAPPIRIRPIPSASCGQQPGGTHAAFVELDSADAPTSFSRVTNASATVLVDGAAAHRVTARAVARVVMDPASMDLFAGSRQEVKLRAQVRRRRLVATLPGGTPHPHLATQHHACAGRAWARLGG